MATPSGRFLSFAVPCLIYFKRSPEVFKFLTHWTLVLHAVSFGSRGAWGPIARLLHGMSFVAAFAVFIAYSLLCLGGASRWGSWHAWETHYRGKFVPKRFAVAQNLIEHAWPVAAVLIEAKMASSRASLQRLYAGEALASMTPRRGLCLAFLCWVSFVKAWEKMTPWERGDTLNLYAQPEWLKTSELLARFGITSAGQSLPQDFLFATALHIAGTLVAVGWYQRVVYPLYPEPNKVKDKRN